MASFTLTRKVEAPPNAVFALFTDLAGAAGRIKDITKIEVVTPGPVGAGTRFRETRVMFGKEHTEEMHISAFDPGRSYEVLCNSCGAEFRTLFRFTADGDDTRVDAEFQTRAVSLMAKLMKPLSWLMIGMMKKCLLKDMEELKAVAEAVGVS